MFNSVVGFGKYVIHDLYTLLQMTVHDGGLYLLKNFKTNQQKWQELQSKEDNTNIPYAMKFSPPTREGGWTGKLRVGEE